VSRDELYEPLGAESRPPNLALDRTRNRLGRLALVACAAGIGVVIWWKSDDMGGEPYATAKIERTPTPQPVLASPRTEPDVTGSIQRSPSLRASADEIESESGVKVVRRGGGEAPGALIIQIPDELGVHLTPSPDPRVTEASNFGRLPKIGVDGSRPADVYARPVMVAASLKPNAPRIAIVVGGMGLNPGATLAASQKLPGAVSLAFAPYGADLEKQVARVRGEGHEVLLQAPMQSIDPGENPGPHTLQADATTDQNLLDLRWQMSRFSGYVGISNFLGAKLMANQSAFVPVLAEIGRRGLFYLDDGSTPAGLTPSPSSAAPSLRADVVIDASQKSETMEAQLNRLESLAKAKGVAIGFATGLPATVDIVSRFARGLERRGVALVPVSSLAPPSTGTVAISGK
jgi:uncharacterized protein